MDKRLLHPATANLSVKNNCKLDTTYQQHPVCKVYLYGAEVKGTTACIKCDCPYVCVPAD